MPTSRARGAGGALTVGLRYGDGTLVMKAGTRRKVFWAGPSIGFDVGGNAAKVFTAGLVLLPSGRRVVPALPAVEGSFYYVGGAGINYQRVDGITLAPIRLGVGLQQRRQHGLCPLPGREVAESVLSV